MIGHRADQARQRLLLHICCGPCASGCLPFWGGRCEDVVGFFFNPNVHPFLENRRRLTSAREAAEHVGVPLVADESYDPEGWFAAVASGGGTRCQECIGLRLDRAAEEAAELGVGAFSTTLSVSPWQDHGAIRARGERAGERYGVSFLYEDLRANYPGSRKLSRERGLYRQQYCGCLVSELERYGGRQGTADEPHERG